MKYIGRPATAASRIDTYDSENVTFHYSCHGDDAYAEEAVPAMDFIERLIQHTEIMAVFAAPSPFTSYPFLTVPHG